MKTLVLYRSQTGYTKKYASWLAEALDAELRENKSINLEDLLPFDLILCGGGVYGDYIDGLEPILKLEPGLGARRLIVWATGANVERHESLAEVWDTLLTEDQKARVPHFYLRGGFDFSKLKGVNRLLMRVLKFVLVRKKDADNAVRDMLNLYDLPQDYSDPDNLEPILQFVGAIS